MAVGRLKVQVKQKGSKRERSHQQEEMQPEMVQLDRSRCYDEPFHRPICRVFLR